MRSPARRARRSRAWFGIVGLGAALVLAAVLVARPYRRAWLVAAVRSVPLRVRLAQARWQPASPHARGVVRCAPARTFGQDGTLLPLDSVPAGTTASALFVWSAASATSATSAASAELRALRTVAPEGALRELTGAGTRAAVLTTNGARLRTARRLAPTTRPQLAVGGSRELCVLAG